MESEDRSGSFDKNIVLVFYTSGANDAIPGLMDDYANALTQAGLSVIKLTFEKSEVDYAVGLMADGKVLVSLTWLGLGQGIGVQAPGTNAALNAFELHQVPLVKLQGDLPAYFIDLHRDVPRNSVNLYQAQEFLDFRRNWLPECSH